MVVGHSMVPALQMPRFPYYLCPTVGSWYRTTVNRLIWALCQDVYLPPPPKYPMLAIEAAKEGIHLESSLWIRNPLNDSHPLVDQIRYQPERLGDPVVVTRIIDLLLTGRTADRREAEAILRAVTLRHSGGPLERVPGRPGCWVTGSPNPKVLRRERLGKALRVQEQVWRAALLGNNRSPRDTLRRLRAEKANPSERAVRDALDNLDSYKSLLAGSSMAAASAAKLYGPRWSPDEVVLNTVREAREWLLQGCDVGRDGQRGGATR